MDFEYSPKVKELQARVTAFMEEHIYPSEPVFKEQLDSAETRWQIPPIMEELKKQARAESLWNLFLPDSQAGYGLTTLEYSPLPEILGRSPFASEAINLSSPDTGHTEVRVSDGT